MQNSRIYKKCGKLILLLIPFFMLKFLYGQSYDCYKKSPLIKIDFGTSSESNEFNLSLLKNYKKANHSCPDDGNYTFTTGTTDCFNGNWHTLLQDHTEGDVNGKMMLVNASIKPGTFFSLKISGLKPGSRYEISNWLVNVCRAGSGCIPTPPNIEMWIIANGKKIAQFETGKILPAAEPKWQKYYGEFTLPLNADAINIVMDDITNGGCGNDFAMDDILLRECILPLPDPFPTTKQQIEEKLQPTVVKPPKIQKPAEPLFIPIPKKKQIAEQVNTENDPKPIQQTIKKNDPRLIVPVLIATRANPVIKQIQLAESELLIELYDNGEIDGDTVSIYHNNQLVVNRALLSAKPISYKLKVNKREPHHELIMVANNLGSIPPNTSLMVVTAKGKRYEVFISSSNQTNAKVVIDLVE